MSEIMFPRAAEEMVAKKPFIIHLSLDTSSDAIRGELKVDHAVLVAMGDQIEQVLLALENLGNLASPGVQF